MDIKEGHHFLEKQKFDSKIQDMFDSLQQKCFFKSFIYKRTFLEEVYQKTPTTKFTWKP